MEQEPGLPLTVERSLRLLKGPRRKAAQLLVSPPRPVPDSNAKRRGKERLMTAVSKMQSGAATGEGSETQS